MPLKPGTMLGHYEILNLIGVGGMGEVYRGHDTKLARADGTGPAEQLTTGENAPTAASWSPDGKVLAFEDSSINTGSDIWVLTLEGERKARPWLQTRFAESRPMFSPDGRWLAYQSNESGRAEVYVQQFSGPGRKWQISTEGGSGPRWARNGRELFYLNGDKMMVAEITTSPTFSASAPRLLFAGGFIPGLVSAFDVAPDGRGS